ncbi:MAG: hypothetical protein ACOYXO_03765, partial [Chloroflexota bacterium]
ITGGVSNSRNWFFPAANGRMTDEEFAGIWLWDDYFIGFDSPVNWCCHNCWSTVIKTHTG